MKIKLPQGNRATKKIWRHIPKFSNDRIVEDIVKDLLKLHIPRSYTNRLEYLFVAKLRSHEYQAAALIKPREFRGDLIYYHVGLADCLYEFSIYYFEFVGKKTSNNILEDHGLRIALMAQDWRKTRPLTIDLDPDLVVKSLDEKLMARAANIAVLTDKFVICHEIAHHLLGHTGKANDAYSLLEKLPQELKSWDNNTNPHAIELQADALATIFMLKLNETSLIKGIRNKSQEAFEAILGCLLVLQVNRFLSNDPDTATNMYPSDNDRLDSCLAILSYYTTPQFPEWVNAHLIIMFAYLNMLQDYSDMIENSSSEREVKSMKDKLKLLLHVRNGIPKST